MLPEVPTPLILEVLPPEVDDDVIFGIMWIKVGVLKTVKSCPPSQVKIQFWGEEFPSVFQPSETNPQTQ